MTNNLMENLKAMGCNPEIVDGGVKLNAPSVSKLYRYDELCGGIRDTFKSVYTEENIDLFQEDWEYDNFECRFLNSDLHTQLSWLCSQGDGVNIYGEVNLIDWLANWQANETDKLLMEMYIDNSFDSFFFDQNSRYTYSLKFKALDEVKGTVDDFINDLPYEMQDADRDLITRFFTDLIEYFIELEDKLEDELYEFIYNPNEDDIREFFEGWLFTFKGDVVTRGY